MSPKKNKAIARQLYDEVFNQGKLDMVDQLVAPDAIEHEEFPGIRGTTPEKLKQFVTTCRSGFPDLQLSVEDIIAEGDKVVCRIVSRGTHHGEFLGLPPTGKPIAVGVIDIIRFAHGRMVEHWGQTDMLGMLQQLGALRPPEPQTS